MNIIEIDSNSQYLDKVKDIYYSSFLESERVDFQDLVDSKFPNSKLFGVFNEDVLIGFSFVSELGDFAYIVYLAIDYKLRNKNYGTEALNLICDLYKDKTKVLCVEKPNTQEDIQSRRIGFYKRNGFLLANFEFEYKGNSYYSMYKGQFDKQEFIDFLLVCFPGCINFKNIKNNIVFEIVSDMNIDAAIKIQHDIFPLENGCEDLKRTFSENDSNAQISQEQWSSKVNLQKYWLAKVNDKYVGICGLYAYWFAPKDAWLGWFGVVEEERGKGYATEILEYSFQLAKKLGFETIRLYTDEKDNANAIRLYKKFGMISEIYDNPEDRHFEISRTLILSKSLTDKPITLWNNKNLYLKAHDEKNKQSFS